MPIYAAAGVQHFWWIQPMPRTLEVMRLVEGKWTLVAVHSDDDKIRAEPFEDIELDLARLWWALPLQASESSELYYSP
jgi:Uma2 family endonuclease